LPSIFSPAFAALVAGALIASIVDIRTRRIPNELTAALATIGVGLAAMGLSGMSVWASLAGLAVGLALMMPGHLLGATGAGDVKLMAAIGSVLGPSTVVTAVVLTALAGGVLAIGIALRRRRLADMIAGTRRLIAAPSGAHQEILAAPAAHRFAYGPAIAIGSVMAALIG
jgi:prepilin peptidase CpaA